MTSATVTTCITLARARVDRKLSMNKVAKKAELSQKTISTIERGGGGHRTTYDTAYAIVDALNALAGDHAPRLDVLDIDWPLGLVDRKKPIGQSDKPGVCVDEYAKKNSCPTCFIELPSGTKKCNYCD